MVYKFASVVGVLAIEVEGGCLRRLWLPCETPPGGTEAGPDSGGVAGEAVSQLHAYLEGRLRRFDLPLAPPPGTDFQRRLLAAIAGVPYGRTATYGSLGPARAVGHVCATNPLPLIIPCHRILPAHGAPGRYRGGSELKRRLLDMEARNTPSPHHAG